MIMKRITLLFGLLLILSNATVAQERTFCLQSDGSFLTRDNGKYLVEEFPNTSRDVLFQKLLVNISSLFVSPQDVISSVPNEMISVNAYVDEIPFFTVSTAVGKHSFSPGTHYVIKIYIKDNKVRIDAPIITGIGKVGSDAFPIWMKRYKLFKNGEVNPKRQDVFDSFHNHFDNLVRSILKTSPTVDEDW